MFCVIIFPNDFFFCGEEYLVLYIKLIYFTKVKKCIRYLSEWHQKFLYNWLDNIWYIYAEKYLKIQ